MVKITRPPLPTPSLRLTSFLPRAAKATHVSKLASAGRLALLLSHCLLSSSQAQAGQQNKSLGEVTCHAYLAKLVGASMSRGRKSC